MSDGFNRSVVGFIYNYPCPLKCNFCCHTSDVVGKGRFTPSKTLPIIQAFAKEKSVIRFAFSGGDPFLYFAEIVDIMRGARDAGVLQPFHVVTSGYWASSYEIALEKLTELRALGSDAIDVSYDYEHKRFVPPSYIENIIKATDVLDMRCEVFGVFWDGEDRLEDLLGTAPDHVSFCSKLAMPMGAAKAFFSEGQAKYDLPDDTKYKCGSPSIYEVAIYPDGSVYPCCSGGFNREANLECGNAFDDSARHILDNIYSNFHARIAKEIGFDKLYEAVKISRPDLLQKLPEFSKVDSVCQICRDIHRDDDLMRALDEVYNNMEVNYVLDRVEREWAALQIQSKAEGAIG